MRMELFKDNICEWQETYFFVFSENIWGNFIYYSHFFPSLSGLVIALIVFFNNPKSRPAQALLFTTSMFMIWSLLDLVLWASDKPEVIMFIWSILIYFEPLIYVGMLYFIYSFLYERRMPLRYEIIIALLFIPYLLFSHTSLNLTAFDYTNCWREAIEGPLWTLYTYWLEAIITLIILTVGSIEFIRNKVRRREILFVTLGSFFFLFSFSFGNIFGSLETDWEIGQIGLFGMPVFVALLAYSIVRFQTFRLKVLATEAIMTAMLLLLISLFFVRTIENSRVIAAITLVLFVVLGSLLIRSVRREVRQREEIEGLAKKLERANVRLKELDKQKSEFVSIASHQLRSPLTAIRGYASMLVDGSYGQLTSKMVEPVNRIQDASRLMAESIEDFLNVSRIEAGNMKYELSDFNLRDRTERIVDDLRPEGFKKGLLLLFKQDLSGTGVVHADVGKTEQILHNLINNALKYTTKGTITVFLHDDPKKKLLTIDVLDTGIGMSEETIMSLFEKFTRAKNANSVNIKGTGLGLYVAREMARKMGGDITAHSEGEGKGSRFSFTIPMVL